MQLCVSDKTLSVSISGDVDEAKALSRPPEDSQGTSVCLLYELEVYDQWGLIFHVFLSQMMKVIQMLKKSNRTRSDLTFILFSSSLSCSLCANVLIFDLSLFRSAGERLLVFNWMTSVKRC